jgi:hypothetical protein
MAKEQRASEPLANFEWDSPPNNRFKAWPIERKSSVGERQGVGSKQQTDNTCTDGHRGGNDH